MTKSPEGVLSIEPDPVEWARLMGQVRKPDQRASTFRLQLGLPKCSPLILTGHQPTIWHPGILAKYFAAEAAAKLLGGDAAWVVADQDSTDYGAIAIPTRDTAGTLNKSILRVTPAPLVDVAAASCSSFEPMPPEAPIDSEVLPSIANGLATIDHRLRLHRNELSAAKQVASAVADMVSMFIPRQPMIFASELCRADVMQELIEQIRRDPAHMASAYNRAAAAHPQARVAPLRFNGSRVELPLWGLHKNTPRIRIWTDSPELDAGDVLAPRGLLVTGLLRLVGCELFIHGIGGGVYDAITEEWFKHWLGTTLAPTVVVTADLTLPLEDVRVSEKAVADAKWRAHRAKHDPALLNDQIATASKAQWVRVIAESKGKGNDARSLYESMHRELAEFRAARASELQRLKDNANRLERELENSAVAGDRTWGFPLYEMDALERLRDQIFNAFGTTFSPTIPKSESVSHPF